MKTALSDERNPVFGIFYEIMINFDKNNRQSLLLTGCKLNCSLTWYGYCCLKRIMKTGQTWPYRKDRDDCNDRVTPRLNSGITNTDNFFDQSIFHHQKIEYESVARADSGDTKILVQCPGNSILKFLFQF